MPYATILIYASSAYLLLINLIAFISYGVDKRRAIRHDRRLSEARLLWLAILGGSVGAILGVSVFHHKTLHKKFTILLPLILIVQVVLAVGLWFFLAWSVLI